MPKLHPQVEHRMKELWQIHGLRATKLNEKIAQEFAKGEKWAQGLPDDTDLPIHRTTPYAMAQRLGWNEDDDGGPISGITDPIWHLSCILAEQKAHQYAYESNIDGIPNPFLGAGETLLEVEQIAFAILMDVDKAYRPKPKMFRKLEPKVIEWVAEEKKAYQAIVADSDNPRRGMQEILAEALANGIEIDDGHAGLGIVYTNPEEQEVDEESE